MKMIFFCMNVKILSLYGLRTSEQQIQPLEMNEKKIKRLCRGYKL